MNPSPVSSGEALAAIDGFQALEQRERGRKQVELRTLVPATFPAYARVLHPAWIDDEGGRRLRWAELAAAVGCQLTGSTQWAALEELAAGIHSIRISVPPISGELSLAESRRILELVGDGRNVPADACFVAYWTGYGFIDESDLQGGVVKIGSTKHVVFCARPADVFEFEIDTGMWHSPNYWWASDFSWCLATGIDFDSSYLGGNGDMVERVLQSSRIEAIDVQPDTRIDIGAGPVRCL